MSLKRRGNGKPFTKGDPRAGRPKGTQNKTTIEVRESARQLVENPVYRENLISRLKAGDAPPAVEAMLWHYAYGKPADRVEVSGPNGEPVSILDQSSALTSEEQRRLLAELVAGARLRIGQGEQPTESSETGGEADGVTDQVPDPKDGGN